MGAGASAKPEALSEDEVKRIEELKALDPEAQKQLAFTAMTDILRSSVDYAMAAGADAETWKTPRFRIPVPNEGTFHSLAESVAKVPLVGAGLAKEITKVVDSISESCVDAATTVAGDPRTKACYADVIAGIVPAENMVQLCQERGGAFAEFLVKTADARLTTSLKPVVADVLKAHALTSSWQAGIDAYNGAAKKLPGIDPMDFDLAGYVLDQCAATLGLLIREREAETRLRVPADASDAVKKIFGDGQKDPEELIMSLVLVPKGDPRQFVVEGPALPAKGAPVPIKTTGGLSIVLKDAETTSANSMNYAFLGVGQPTDAGVGAAPSFHVDGKFLVAEACGKTLLLDFCYGRYHEGNAVVLANSTKGDKETYKPHRSTEWVLTKDQTIATCRNSDYCLGVRLDDKKKAE